MTTRLGLLCFLLLAWPSTEVGAQLPELLEQERQVTRSLQSLTTQLIQVANDETAREQDRQAAIRAIGRLRPSEAVPHLLNNLQFRAGEEVSVIWPLITFTAAQALARYDSAIYPEIWAYLEQERSEDSLYLLAFILYYIDGREVAALRVQQRLAQRAPLTDLEPFIQEARNLNSLLGFLKEVNPSDPSTFPQIRKRR